MNTLRTVLRSKKLKSFEEIRYMSNHNNRTTKAKNVRGDLPMHLKDQVIIGTKIPFNDVKNYLEAHSVNNLRKNGVIAIEFVLSASPEYFYEQSADDNRSINQEKLRKWHLASIEWLKESFGETCVNAISHYYSESTPHIHAVIVPLVERTNKAGIKLSKLNAAGIVGNPTLLSNLQTSYANALSHLKIQRGIKGSKANHTDLKYFHETVNMLKYFLSEIFPQKFIQAHPNGLFMIEAFRRLTQKLHHQAAEIKELRINNEELAAISNYLLDAAHTPPHDNAFKRSSPSP